MPVKKCQACGAKQVKTKRAPNAWNNFVKKQMHTLPIQSIKNPKDKMRAIAKQWKKRKGDDDCED